LTHLLQFSPLLHVGVAEMVSVNLIMVRIVNLVPLIVNGQQIFVVVVFIHI
jgi:hypothetical protein